MGVISVSQVRNGQVVRFDYRGGERDGYRLVEVQKNEKGSIGGIDRSKGEYRQYRHDRINSAVSLVADVNEEIVNTASFLVDTSIPIDKAAGVYRMLNADRADSVRVDRDANVLVVGRSDLPRIDVSLSSEFLVIEFTNKKGEKTGVRMGHQNPNVTDTTYTCSPDLEHYDTFVNTLYEQHTGKPASVASSLGASNGNRVFEVGPTGTATVKTPTRWEDMLKNRALVGINKRI